MLVTRVKARSLVLVLELVPAHGFVQALGFVQVLVEQFTPRSPKIVIREPPQLLQLTHLQVAVDHRCFSKNQTSRIC